MYTLFSVSLIFYLVEMEGNEKECVEAEVPACMP
jgi:hypothetical protein